MRIVLIQSKRIRVLFERQLKLHSRFSRDTPKA